MPPEKFGRRAAPLRKVRTVGFIIRSFSQVSSKDPEGRSPSLRAWEAFPEEAACSLASMMGWIPGGGSAGGRAGRGRAPQGRSVGGRQLGCWKERLPRGG